MAYRRVPAGGEGTLEELKGSWRDSCDRTWKLLTCLEKGVCQSDGKHVLDMQAGELAL